MLYSFKLLKKLANLPIEIKVENVSEAILSLGFEVENITKFANVEGIKFGKIQKIVKNPNADKLNVCEIKFSDKNRTIQTSANNIKVNDVVIAFVPGSRAGDIIFDKKELKGIVSEGMLSNISEFYINKEYLRTEWYKGIGIYKNVSIKEDPVEYLELNDDIIDVDILTNRSDAASYLIMANELAAYFKTEPLKLKENKPLIDSSLKVKNGFSHLLTFVEVKNNFEISVKEQILLAKHKIKSINNAADLSNLIRLYSGVPSHVYDKKQVGSHFEAGIHSGKVNVSGGKEVKLEDSLVIYSDKKPVSVASVIGMEQIQVTNKTQDIFVELGIFPNNLVRKSMREVKIETPSAIQGAKQITRGMVDLAYKYLSSRVSQFSKLVNFSQNQYKPIKFDVKKLSMIMGEQVAGSKNYLQAIKGLKILGFKINDDRITPPSYRHDVKTQQDLNEEFMRLIGYDSIKQQQPLVNRFKISNIISFKKALSSVGMNEVRTYLLTSNAKNIINPFKVKEQVKLFTNYSSERDVIRLSQVTSLQEIALYNLKRGTKHVNIFSEGYIGTSHKTVAIYTTSKTFREVKEIISNLIIGVSYKRKEFLNVHPNISAQIIFDGNPIGFIGKTHPKTRVANAVIAEFIVDDYQKNLMFSDYNSAPLKFNDQNYELDKHEDLDTKFKVENKSFSQEVIDEYMDNGSRKITIRTVKEK